MTLDYSDLRKEYSEKRKVESKRYGVFSESKVEANQHNSEREEKRKEFWTYLMTSFMEELEA